MDLRHGFHQMPLRKDSRPLTCMCTPCGPVQWTVMPMGLKNAPSFFQRVMEDVLFTAHPEAEGPPHTPHAVVPNKRMCPSGRTVERHGRTGTLMAISSTEALP